MSDPGYTQTEGHVSIDAMSTMTNGFYPLNVDISNETGRYDKDYELLPSTVKKVEGSFVIKFNEEIQAFNALPTED